MLLSMALIGLLAGFIYLFVPHDESKDPVKPISYDVEVATARRAAPYPVAAPQQLPEGWRATSVWYRAESDLGTHWHLGLLDPESEYAAVEQSDHAPEEFIESVTHAAEPVGDVQRVGGQEWQRYEGEKYDALVLREQGVTTVVTGTAPFRQLAELAGVLRAERG